MPLTENQRLQLQGFFNQSQFEKRGAFITDLDGTAIHEYEGRYSIPQTVELGLNRVYELGRPVVLNTLRFPLSVIRTFGKEWYKISNASIPTILMNGSQLGFITQAENGEFGYEEIAAFPLLPEEIQKPLDIALGFMEQNVMDILVFYYPRNWQLGEIIWTPEEARVGKVQNKYQSASKVYSSPIAGLKENLLSQEICMVFLLIDMPQDKLMAYQHTKRSNFFTHEGVDKEFGAEEISRHLDFELKHSVGAGDSEMDTFLKSIGLAVHVGNPFLNYEGLVPPIKLNNSLELGELLFELAAMQRTVIA